MTNRSLQAAVTNWIWEALHHLKTQEMCDDMIDEEPWDLEFIPDHLKTWEICAKAVHKDPCLLQKTQDHL